MSSELKKIGETGLYNEQVFKLLAEYELTRVQRYPSPVSLLHISPNLEEAKPEIVKTVEQLFAGILNTSLRISDIPAHYDKDFLVLMPATDEIGAQAAASRLIARLQGTRKFADGKLFKFNIHIGIASHPGGKDVSVDSLLQQAESALQEARKAGLQAYIVFSE